MTTPRRQMSPSLRDGLIPADQYTIVTVTITEDKIGTWEIGCFQEKGQYYV